MVNPSAVPIAIVSIGALFPGAPTTQAFWQDVVEGRDRLTEVPRTHWLAADYFDPTPGTPDKVYTTRGGFLPEVAFSPLDFGLPPSTLPAIDTAQLLALVVAQRVLAEATGGRYETMDRSRVSVLLGVASATEMVAHMSGRLQIPIVEAAMRAAGIGDADARRVRSALESCYVPWQEGTFPGMLGNVVAGRIANRFDLGGTNAVLDAACAGSLAAVSMAVHELSSNRADLVITGGVDTLNDILMFMCFAQTGALSRSGDCRPFSKDADGTMLGEGVGLFALRRLADAERDGDPIHAVIRGVGSSSDGRATSIYAPLASGQVRALERAYADAGVSPATVGLVEAHGTGTIAGDAAELEALRVVYDRAGARPTRTAVGSVKSQIGHTKAAAGAAGLAKAALALHHKVLPPTIKVSAPVDSLSDDGSPFYLNTVVRPWIHGEGHPRRAAVSALGFGGTNFHVVLEEHVGGPRPPRIHAVPTELVVLGAPDARGLAERCRTEAAALAKAGALVHLAWRSQLAFDPALAHRVALVASTEEELAKALEHAAEALDAGRSQAQSGTFFGEGPPLGPVAFLFPGQGSQYVGMGSDLAVHFDDAREVWDEAARCEAFGEAGLHARVFPPAAFDEAEEAAQARRLTATEWAQPALACASLAMWRVCRRVGLSPVAVAGHSLGEVTALAASGALEPLVAIRVARTRGERMADAGLGEGAMTAVAADHGRIEALLAGWQVPVTIANHNAPLQVVLSGERAAIADVEARLAVEGITTQRLSVATAFHSPVVEAASAPFRVALDGVELGRFAVPVFSNVTAAPYPADPRAARDQLAAAIARPVRFAEQIDAMFVAGARTFIEVGPGQVLTRLVGRCLEGRPHLAVALDQQGKHGVTAFFQALAQLAVAGVPLDLARLWDGQALPADPSTETTSKLVMRLNGANYGKPYPERAPAAMPASERPKAEPSAAPPVVHASTPREAPPPLAATVDAAQWSAAIRELHAPLIAAQAEYVRTMAETHTAFLRAVEASYATLARSVGGAADLVATSSVLPAPAVAPPAVATPPRRPPSPPPAVMAAPPPRSAPAPAAVAPAAPTDLLPLMLDVVAEKTGYPKEMIEVTMDLESDLGIDSIKRVEILAATRLRAPGLPVVEPARLAKLRTLAAIVDFLESGGTAPPGQPPPAPRIPRATAGPGPAPRRAVSRLVVERVPSAAPGLATPWLFEPGLLAILPDDRGVAELLAARLRGHGLTAEVSAHVPEGARGVIFLGGLREIGSVDAAIDVSRDAFEAARTFARRGREGNGVFVTVQDTGGDLGVSGGAGERAWLGGLAGLAKSAAEEWPSSCVRAIDVACSGRGPEAIADALVRELLNGGAEREVGLAADGTRITLAAAPAPDAPDADPAAPALGRGEVVLVSGGARGVTAACVLELAAAVGPRLVLIGRTVLAPEPAHFRGIDTDADAELKRASLEAARGAGTPSSPRDIGREVDQLRCMREVRATLARLSELGVEARYEAVDVRDAAALDAILDDVRRRWGPVRGLVHGAGVVADALLETRTDSSQLDRVLDTKVRGLAALLRATERDPLSAICLFSSVAARAGNAGQADYAMANETLNKVAAAEARRRGAGVRVVSIGWGPWEGGMVTPALRGHFAARGVDLLALDEGARAFVNEFRAGERRDGGARPSVEVLLGGARLGVADVARRGDLWIDATTMPYLADHRVRGTVVVPMVLAMEWFARSASNGGRDPLSLGDVRVRRGMLLPDFGRSGERIRIVATRRSDEGDKLELLDAAGAARFEARLDLVSPPTDRATPAPSSRGGRATLPGPLYAANRLFHGPQFQVVSELHAISAEGGHATVTGTLDADWFGGPWRTDPAAIDAALQVALLSSLSAGMGPTLPLAIGRATFYRPPARGPIACVVELRDRTRERATFDAWLTAADGSPIAELARIEMFAAPSGTA